MVLTLICLSFTLTLGIIHAAAGSPQSDGIVEVTMKGDANGQNYHPATVVVVVGVNNTVVWVNDDTAPHTVTATSVPAGAQMFDSGRLNPGQNFTYTFTVPGNYTYHCIYHPWMVGTVVVLAAATTTATTTTTTSTATTTSTTKPAASTPNWPLIATVVAVVVVALAAGTLLARRR